MIIDLLKKYYMGVRRPLSRLMNKLWEPFCIWRAPYYNRMSLRKLKGKKQIKCVFFVFGSWGWKYDYVFKKMLSSTRFDPVILICPQYGYGEQFMKNSLIDAENFFKVKKQYPTRLAYDVIGNKRLNIKKVINPDIIFYCSPYKNQYYITDYQKILSVYVPYTFNNSNDYEAFHNELLHNLVWRYYAETIEHKQYSVDYARNRGINVVVAGYPGIEAFLDKAYVPSCNDWKIKNNSLKRIIWAPHHTIANTGTVIFSCFLRYADFMLEMAKKYMDKVQLVFKPHPLLRPKLEQAWGKEKTDAYFKEWEDMPNTSYSKGNYVDLFLTSDAMIHDSGSFIAEYLYLNKPVIRTMNDYPIEKMYNPFIQRCIDVHYKAYSSEDIESFILQVIKGEDSMKETRMAFVNSVMMPNGLPSENIINDILDSIDNQILYRN